VSDPGKGLFRPAAVFTAGFALRLALIAINPIIFGGDTILRLGDRFTLVKAHQLPLLQLLIAGVSLVSMDPVWVRLLMAIIGAGAGVGFYLLTRDIFGEPIAFASGLLFATNPYITAVSTVPFQEILMLGTLFFAFHYFYREGWWAASLWLAAACLTRHEAWAACPVLAGAYWWRYRRSWAGAAMGLLWFGWVPAVWIIASRGLAPGIHYVVEPTLSLARFVRWAYVAWIAVKFSQATVVALAAVGVWRLIRRRAAIDWRFALPAIFTGLFLIALLFSAHGVTPDPERYVTSREAHVPICFAILLAAVGLQQWPRLLAPIVSVSIVLGVVGAWWYLRIETSEPDVQVSYRMARYLDANVGKDEKVQVVPVDRNDAWLYFRKVRQLFGPEAELQARAEVRREQPEPFEVVRLRVYSHLRPDQLQVQSQSCHNWLVTWDDVQKPDWAREPKVTIRTGTITASAFRHECP